MRRRLRIGLKFDSRWGRGTSSDHAHSVPACSVSLVLLHDIQGFATAHQQAAREQMLEASPRRMEALELDIAMVRPSLGVPGRRRDPKLVCSLVDTRRCANGGMHANL